MLTDYWGSDKMIKDIRQTGIVVTKLEASLHYLS